MKMIGLAWAGALPAFALFCLQPLVGAASVMPSPGVHFCFSSDDTGHSFCLRQLPFADRVAYQRAIEEVYWRHRIWPQERTDAKPSLEAVMSQATIEQKV